MILHSLFLASEANPWNFGVYAMSGKSLNKVGGFSIVAQQLPCGNGPAVAGEETGE